MTHDAIDAGAAAAHIIKRMYRRFDLGAGRTGHAVVETERPFAGDSWFWTDDNAKVLELLARPGLSRRYAGEAAELFRFLRLMCRPPLIFRRFSAPRLEATGRDGALWSFYHSLMHLRCHLPTGSVMAGVRFHDDRTADNLLLSANSVEFSHRGRRHSIDVGAAIDASDAEQRGDSLVLWHSGDLRFVSRRRSRRLGRVTYRYEVSARSMLIGVEATLEVDPAADVGDVVLTVGHDHLSHRGSNVFYSEIAAALPAQAPRRVAAGEPGRGFVAAPGATYYSISQKEMAGFALAVHSAPRQPERLEGIETLVRIPGEWHFARARYRFPGSCRGARLVAGEDKLLTAGGFYERADDYAAILRDAIARRPAQEMAYDYSMSYDYGAELNAFASLFAAASAYNSDGGVAALRDELRATFDTFLEVYFELFVAAHRDKKNTVFSRQLAFVVVGLVTMYEATGAAPYRRRLAELCDLILEFEKRFEDVAGAAVSGFMMGVYTQRIVFADCNSAALFALAKAAPYVEDPRLAPAIDRGLGCYCIDTTRIDWHDGPHKVDVVAVEWVDDDGARKRNSAFWNYHVGLTLRLFAALRNSPEAALRAIAARHAERIELFETMMRRQVERSLYREDGAVEIRCSVLSGETNSETQPWATLGLLDRGWAEA
jgi:hypothetical protein